MNPLSELVGGAIRNEERGRTQSQILLEIAKATELFRTPEGDAFVSYPVEHGIETAPVESTGFRDWLRERFYSIEGKVPGAQTFRDSVSQIAANAKFGGSVKNVHLRVAGLNGLIYIDLCNRAFEVVEISSRGWQIILDPPVKFRRTRGMAPLPHPRHGASLDLLSRHIRVKDPTLVYAWLIGSLKPTGPYPVLTIQGEQGSGKSLCSRLLRTIIDPSTVPTRSQPREERDLVIGAFNGWVLAFDNLSGLRDWLSDALCRIATGGGFGTRRLYENKEEELFYQQRPILVNGIEDIATRPDLADRAISIELDAIPEHERKTESELLKLFENDLPLILGALFDAVSVGLKNVDRIELDNLPRMADFAKFATAALPGRDFLAVYQRNRHSTVEITVSSDSVASAIAELLDASESWEGTTSGLMEEIKSYLPKPDKPPKDFPTSVQAMTARLRRIMPALRAVGIVRIDLPRPTQSRARIFRLERTRSGTSTTFIPSKAANVSQNGRSVMDEGVDKEGKSLAARPPPRLMENTPPDAGISDVAKVDTMDTREQSVSNGRLNGLELGDPVMADKGKGVFRETFSVHGEEKVAVWHEHLLETVVYPAGRVSKLGDANHKGPG